MNWKKVVSVVTGLLLILTWPILKLAEVLLTLIGGGS